MTRVHATCCALALVSLLACNEGGPHGDTATPAGQGGEAAATNQERVEALLHEEFPGLLGVPEVKEQSDFFIRQYRSGEMTREAAAREFRLWLERWVEANPDVASGLRSSDAE